MIRQDVPKSESLFIMGTRLSVCSIKSIAPLQVQHQIPKYHMIILRYLKALYYGWGGPGQWSGFNGKESGIVLTSLLLDTYYSNGNHSGATSNGVSFNAFKSFVESQPAPNDEVLGFDKSSASVKWDPKNKIQKTEEITITSNGLRNPGHKHIDFKIPDGVTLVLADGTRKTGSISR